MQWLSLEGQRGRLNLSEGSLLSLHFVFITRFIKVSFTDHKIQLFKEDNSVVLVTLLGGTTFRIEF